MALSKDQIVAASDRDTKTVEVPEWGGEVVLRTMSGTERNAYEQSLIRYQGDNVTPNMANIHAKLLAKCIVDDNNGRLFTDAEIHELGAKSAGVLARLFDAASEMNGLNERDVKKLAGNSEAAQSGDSTSD